jgi:magnesium chelatase family protein
MIFPTHPPDFSEIRGLDATVHELERAVATHVASPGTHGVLLVGPPGIGKTMLARRVPTILPALPDHDWDWLIAEYAGIGYDVIQPSRTARPFRAPQHTISVAALAGNAPVSRNTIPCRCKRAVNGHCQWHTLPPLAVPRAGELHLARFGVLFLDELAEFTNAAIEALSYALARMSERTRPLIIAASNPCSCGWHGSSVRECTCTAESLARYDARLGKLVSKLAVHYQIAVPSLSLSDMREGAPCESSDVIRDRVIASLGAVTP